MSDDLRERVAKLFCTAAEGRRWGCGEPKCWCYIQADIARALIRAEVLEEAARVADGACIPMCEGSADLIAAAIRALKEKQ